MGEVVVFHTPEAPASKSPGANQYEPGEFRNYRGSTINAGGGKDE
ncbi:hypothetical protein [Methyloceanibacter sp.]